MNALHQHGSYKNWTSPKNFWLVFWCSRLKDWTALKSFWTTLALLLLNILAPEILSKSAMWYMVRKQPFLSFLLIDHRSSILNLYICHLRIAVQILCNSSRTCMACPTLEKLKIFNTM